MKETAQEYLCGQLEQGLTLSRKILELIKWNEGHYSLIHSDELLNLEPSEKYDFSLGTMLTTQRHEYIQPDGRVARVQYNDRAEKSRKKIALFYSTRVEESTEISPCIFIAEDILFSRSDPNYYTGEVFYHEEEVYFILASPIMTIEIDKILGLTEYAWRSMGFLATHTKGELSQERELSEHFLVEKAQSIVVMHARALDSEGYVLWNRYKK